MVRYYLEAVYHSTLNKKSSIVKANFFEIEAKDPVR